MPVFGLNHGLMPILGFNYGAKKKERIYSAMRIGTLIAVLIMAVGTLAFELFPRELLMIFNPTPEAMEIGVVAFRLIAFCFLPAAVGIVASTLFQAVGMGTKSLFISILRQLVIILPAAYLLSKIGLNYVWAAWPIAEFVALVVALIFMAGIFRSHISRLDEPGFHTA